MGRHASADRRRSVAAWPIVVGVVVLLLVVATVGYFQLTTRDGDKVAAACTGSTVLPVVVGPAAAPAVIRAADAFNATKPAARSRCISVSVTTMSGAAAAGALAGGWRGQRTSAPGLWIADSAADVAALDAADPAMTAGHPTQGLAGSPVVLAVRQAPAGTSPSWAALAAGSGPVLGIGDPTVDGGAAAALQSLVRGASATPTAGSAIDAADVTAAAPVLARLAGASSTVPATTDLALTELAGGQSRFTAVPVYESQLATFNAAGGSALTAVYPIGPTAAVTVLPVPLTADWVTSAMSDAAAAFVGFLGDAAGTAILGASHLRTAAAPAAAEGVDLRRPVTALADAGPATSAAVAAAWKAARSTPSAEPTGALATSGGSAGTTAVPTNPLAATGTAAPDTTAAADTTAAPGTTAAADTTAAPASTATPTRTSVAATSSAVPAGAAITFLVDTSGSMRTVNDGAQRFTWVKAAISTVMEQRPRSSIGLWTFATSSTESIPLGALDEPVDGVPRSSAVVAALNAVTPSGDSHTYGAIRTAFTAAADDADAAGVSHRMIVLTDGSDSTPGLSRDAIKSSVAALVSRHPGLTLDIVGLSSGVNEQALTEIAAAGGGTFTPVDSLADLGRVLLTLSS